MTPSPILNKAKLALQFLMAVSIIKKEAKPIKSHVILLLIDSIKGPYISKPSRLRQVQMH